MSDPIRVLIVDDSAFVRRAVERMLDSDPGIRVVGAASDGVEAVQLVRQLAPDVVLLDVNMPEMDGLAALEHIMQHTPTRVILMSTFTRSGAEVTLRALEMGAVDFIDKTTAGSAMDIYALAPLIREKVAAATQVRSPAAAPAEPAGSGRTADSTEHPPPARPQAEDAYHQAIVIGASTGGPRALTSLIAALPADLPTGLIVAQHMPRGFTAALAERLNRESRLQVREARDGDPVVPGQVLIAPGGQQTSLVRARGTLRVRICNRSSAPAVLHHPSVDLLFCAAAEVLGPRCIGVILTGMGRDGAAGLQRLREAGARTIVESADTALIDGMPRAARPAAEQVLRLDAIPGELTRLCAVSTGRKEQS